MEGDDAFIRDLSSGEELPLFRPKKNDEKRVVEALNSYEARKIARELKAIEESEEREKKARKIAKEAVKVRGKDDVEDEEEGVLSGWIYPKKSRRPDKIEEKPQKAGANDFQQRIQNLRNRVKNVGSAGKEFSLDLSDVAIEPFVEIIEVDDRDDFARDFEETLKNVAFYARNDALKEKKIYEPLSGNDISEAEKRDEMVFKRAQEIYFRLLMFPNRIVAQFPKKAEPFLEKKEIEEILRGKK